jgi:hypothetical protein
MEYLMSETTQTPPAEQETKTRITTVSVRVKQELDTGYLPFLRWMKKNNWKNPPFGMRDATRATFEIWMSAEVGTDMTAEQAVQALASQGHALLDQELRAHYPEAFPHKAAVTEKAEVPEEAFIIASTEVVDAPAEDY